jgi:hypothetical protein
MAVNAVLSLAALVCAYASYAAFELDRLSRVPASSFAERFTMPLRHPDVFTSLDYAPSGDFASDLVADTTLRDVYLTVNLKNLEPKEVAAWIESVQTRDQQLAQAADAMLIALSERPGWPYHASLLGQLVYTRGALAFSPDLVGQYRRWSVPLTAGALAAPNDPEVWQLLALSYIQTWPDLARAHAPIARGVFQNAFEDPEFVRTTFRTAMQTIGTETVIGVLPDSPRPLWSAFEQLVAANEIDAAWRVHQRWDSAEWRQRQLDLDVLERIAVRSDVMDLRQACRKWLGAHSVWDYDSPSSRAQVARVLQLWPVSDVGRWPADPRVDAIAYLLSGRRDNLDGAAIARAAATLTGMPAAMQAQLHVLAGDIAGAETIARAAESFGSLEWTPYVLELSRYWLQRGNRDRARAALDLLSSASRPECESTIARAAVGDGSPAGSSGTVSVVRSGEWSVPLCLAQRQPASVTFMLTNGSAVIVDYGWNRARSGSLLLSRPGEAVPIALPATQGFRAVTVSCMPVSSTVSMTVTPSGAS